MGQTTIAPAAPAATTEPAAPTALILAPAITFPLANGRILSGRLEYFRASKSLAVFDDEALTPSLLTVPVADVPAEHEALGADEVLLRNWTEMRGTAEALVQLGIVELTGQTLRVGVFGLHAVVARVL